VNKSKLSVTDFFNFLAEALVTVSIFLPWLSVSQYLQRYWIYLIGATPEGYPIDYFENKLWRELAWWRPLSLSFMIASSISGLLLLLSRYKGAGFKKTKSLSLFPGLTALAALCTVFYFLQRFIYSWRLGSYGGTFSYGVILTFLGAFIWFIGNGLTMKERPLGVTIIAILDIFIGLVSSIFVSMAFVDFVDIFRLNMSLELSLGWSEAAPDIALLICVPIIAILGILSLVTAYGFWTGEGWAWTLGLILAVIGLSLGILDLLFFFIVLLEGIIVGIIYGIIPIIIYGIIIYYLTRPHVKAFFGKAPSPPPSPPQT
jgi:hypothetical protein